MEPHVEPINTRQISILEDILVVLRSSWMHAVGMGMFTGMCALLVLVSGPVNFHAPSKF